MQPTSAIEYRRLRAPREHGQALIGPPLEELPASLEANIALARKHFGDIDVAVRPLSELASAARAELVPLAQQHVAKYLDRGSVHDWRPEQPIILAGHQPELFHPGVWFKNFLLARLAQTYDLDDADGSAVLQARLGELEAAGLVERV